MTSIEKILEIMRNDKSVRRAIVKRSHKFFFHYYLPHYIEYPIAPFHEELFDLTQNDKHSMMVVSAFRNSGKSTLLSLSYVIWAIVSGRAKYVIIISENQQKAQTLLGHIKAELTENESLKRDLGPFQEERIGWNAVSLTLKNHGAKITAVSTEQSVRGLRHLNHRPDLIIIDDSENQESVKTQEGRDKLFRWVTGDVIPAGTKHTRLIVIGSVLHPDGLITRFQNGIDEGRINGIYRMYPIVDDEGRPLWPGKFPDATSVMEEKLRGITDREWTIEYLLRSVPTDEQVILPDWIHYYDELPSLEKNGYKFTWAGVDLAISEKSTADYTAIVAAQVHGERTTRKIYILPNPINRRMTFPDLVTLCQEYSRTVLRGGKLLIESVAFQAGLAQILHKSGYHTEGVPVRGDKRSRLAMTSALIQNGTILFPRKGAEKLVQQLVGYGVEKHDDLMDAFTLLIHRLMEEDNRPRAQIIWLSGGCEDPLLSNRGWRNFFQ